MMPDHNGIRASFEIWPFHTKDAFNGITTNDSAWPHEEGKVFGPLIGWFEWSGEENDKFWLNEIKKALKTLHEVSASRSGPVPESFRNQGPRTRTAKNRKKPVVTGSVINTLK